MFVHPADSFGDGVVDGSDLSILLLTWGSADAVTDFDGNLNVDGIDLAHMLSNWGEVPIYGEWSWDFGTNMFLEDAATGDFDHDGDTDFAVANQDGSISVFLNRHF